MATTNYIRPIFVPSTTEGKNWKVDYIKPTRGPGYTMATEGVVEYTSGVPFFCFPLVQARRCKATLPGRASQKAVLSALRELLQEMQAHEFIERQDIEPLIAKATL